VTPLSFFPHHWVAVLAVLSIGLILAGVLARAARSLPRRIDPELGAAQHPRHPARRRLLLVASPIFALASLWAFDAPLSAALATVFVVVLLALAWIDAETGLLPDLLTQPLLWLGLVANLGGRFVPLEDAVIGAVAGYLVLWSVYWAFLLATRRESLGRGDLKLLAALGAWLGWMSLPWLLLISAGLGLLVALGLRMQGRLAAGQALCFGPCLAVAGILVLFTLPAAM
jgi:leader peptidase (prepilin peptidase)/N-methyltransferase